jgi:putative two-component system hydrogenase maturation factor HypX/HoxX
MPLDPLRKGALYNGPVADAAVALVREVVERAADPAFRPTPLDYRRPDVHGRPMPAMRQRDRAFGWSDATADIVRRIRASDGSPGVRTTLLGRSVSVFDAHPGPALPGAPGAVLRRCRGAVLVRTGDGGVWIGRARVHDEDGTSVKLPAAAALGVCALGVPELLDPRHDAVDDGGFRDIRYRREGDVGVLTFDFYNGAMSAGRCRRLLGALRHATAQDTRVLVLRGGETFSNGIDLAVIDHARDPAQEAWRTINAIDDVCREIITCTDQLVVASVTGNAGAGGVMLALGADRVLVRDGAVLNPHYRTMGLHGSEYWTYVLPRRVGEEAAGRLTRQCRPIGARHAVDIGLADGVVSGSRDEAEQAVLEHARAWATSRRYGTLLGDRRARRSADERRRPLEAYRAQELAEMSRDMFDDRRGFAAARRAFLTRQSPGGWHVATTPVPARAPAPVASSVPARVPVGPAPPAPRRAPCWDRGPW